MKISADLSGVHALVAQLGAAAEEARRPAAQAMAQVLYDRVKLNVSKIGKKTGNLDSSIYQKFSPELSIDGKSVYNISWNHLKAPHGHLVEFGYLQRYEVRLGKNGKWYTAVRAEALAAGMKRPGRRATQAQKDAYYMPRPGGPVQWLGKAFVREAQSQIPAAQNAGEAVLLKKIAEVAGA